MRTARTSRMLPLSAAVFLLAVTAAAAEARPYFSLQAKARHGAGVDDGRTVEAAAELSPRLEAALSPRTRLEISARVRFDDADRLTPDAPALDSYARASRPRALGTRALAELRDAFVQIDLNRSQLKLGKQQIVWGSLDGIKVLDALNPQSFREFILEDFGSSRIGLWSLYGETTVGGARFELALIPDTTTHEVPEPGAWFELTAPRYRFGATGQSPALPVTVRRPGDGLENGTVGLRTSFRLGRLDLSLVGISGLDFEPLGRVITTPEGSPEVERHHERRELVGVSAESALGRFAFRAEGAFLPSRHFNVRSGDSLLAQRLDQWRAAVGMDVQAPLGVFLNVQYLHDRVLRAPHGLVRPRREEIVTVFVRRRFSYDRISTELRWYTSLDEHDGMIRAEIGYQFSSGLGVRLAGDSFYGRATGIFGQFDEKSRVTLTLEHTF